MSLEDACAEFSVLDMCHLYPLGGYDPTLSAWNVYQIRDRWCRTERGLNRCGGCHLRDSGLFNNNQVVLCAVRLVDNVYVYHHYHLEYSTYEDNTARSMRCGWALGARGCTWRSSRTTSANTRTGAPAWRTCASASCSFRCLSSVLS